MDKPSEPAVPTITIDSSVPTSAADSPPVVNLLPVANHSSSTPDIPKQHMMHLTEGMAFSGLRRAISQVSMMVAKATTSGEAAWREEIIKYRHTRFSSRRVRKRVVFKHGDCNVVQGNVAKRRRRYLQDIFTTLVDAQWRWTLLVFAMNFLLSWLGFALIWWLILYSHGDLDPDNLNNPNKSWTPCVEDIHGFTSCFLFSVETQHTIGYGSKHTTEECPEAIFVMCIQSMTGVILQAFMVGIVFAKLSRPKKRTQTLLFSRNAVICQRDGQSCLMFRVGDMRKSHIIEAHIRAQMIKRKVTREGELLPFFQTELKVGGDGEEDKIIFIWPTTIVHIIDEHSPLYNISASDMLRERFEIIVMLEGVIESTGMTTQARSSYLPSEILWGHRFEHIITFRKETGEYEVNYTLFNNTYEVDTPLCSAAELDQLTAIHRAKGERLSSGIFPTYRDESSSSLTTSSGSSLASSASLGGITMNLPSTTPLTPIPVIITEPDEPPRQNNDSVIQPSSESRPFFYAGDDEEQPQPKYRSEVALNMIPYFTSTSEGRRRRSIEDDLTQKQNTNLHADGSSGDGKSFVSKTNLQRLKANSKSNFSLRKDSLKNTVEVVKRSLSRTLLDSKENLPGMHKSPSKGTLDFRQTRFSEVTEKPPKTEGSSKPRRLSLSETQKLLPTETRKPSIFAMKNIQELSPVKSDEETSTSKLDADNSSSNHHLPLLSAEK